MSRNWTLVGISLLFFGCAQAKTPATLPKPVTVNVPAQTPVTTPGDSPADVAGLHGKWEHTLPGGDTGERRIVLKYIKDQDGPERFEIVQHDWPDKPVFVEQITNGNETELHFKMVAKENESQDTSRTLRYVLHEDQGKWVGTLFESWNAAPHNVVLTKTE